MISRSARRTKSLRPAAVPSSPFIKARSSSRVRTGADNLSIGMLPGAPAPTESPLSCCNSGRVHPNPLFQQAYAFTVAKRRLSPERRSARL